MPTSLLVKPVYLHVTCTGPWKYYAAHICNIQHVPDGRQADQGPKVFVSLAGDLIVAKNFTMAKAYTRRE